MNFFHTYNYIAYYLFSRHKKGHGIHSPFIFNLVSIVFRNKTDYNIVCSVEKIRKKLVRDKRMITVNDLGSGSLKRKSKIRKVSDIARYSPVSAKYGTLLANLSAAFGSSDIIELGTSLGISTMYLAMANPGAIVHTIEGCPECAGIARENFDETGITNIDLHTGSFDDVLPSITTSGIKPGLVFIDGNHRKEPVLKYFEMIYEVIGRHSVLIIDDIHDSKEMNEAWETIKNDSRVSITVDIFRMGLVFFRGGVTPNNYVIRY